MRTLVCKQITESVMQIEEKQTILEPFSMAKPESAQRAEEKWLCNILYRRTEKRTLQHYESTRSIETWRTESKLRRKEEADGTWRRDADTRGKCHSDHIRLRWRLA
jgi:hypothetical protein